MVVTPLVAGLGMIAYAMWAFRRRGEFEKTCPRTRFYRSLRISHAAVALVFGVGCLAAGLARALR